VILAPLLNAARSIASGRFLRFGIVGASGVVVNLGLLWFLADVLGWHENLSSALAIEGSIFWNFLFNDGWTFRDRRQESAGWWGRAWRYHLVTGVGAVIQWVVFMATNLVFFLVISDPGAAADYFGGSGVLAAVVRPVLHPPEVGAFMYLAQMVGIGTAMLWNFLANLHWTWRPRPAQQAPANPSPPPSDVG
jgi:putative flippase GtrA